VAAAGLVNSGRKFEAPGVEPTGRAPAKCVRSTRPSVRRAASSCLTASSAWASAGVSKLQSCVSLPVARAVVWDVLSIVADQLNDAVHSEQIVLRGFCGRYNDAMRNLIAHFT
jgi:hypothetical protein